MREKSGDAGFFARSLWAVNILFVIPEMGGGLSQEPGMAFSLSWEESRRLQ